MLLIATKVISAVMSLVIFLSGTFPALFNGEKYINPYGEEVIISEFIYSLRTPWIFSDYNDFDNFHYGYCVVYDTPKDYEREFFENKNLVVVREEQDNKDFDVIVKSIKEKEDTLIVEYVTIVYPEYEYHPESINIFIETSKNIKNVEIKEKTIEF